MEPLVCLDVQDIAEMVIADASLHLSRCIPSDACDCMDRVERVRAQVKEQTGVDL